MQTYKNSDNMISGRIEWLDTLKGIGVILVLIGHILNNDSNLKIFIYSFHMPLFFFVSGILYSHKKDFLHFCKNKISRLLIPYFSFSFISLIFCIYIDKINPNVIEIIKGISLYNNLNPYNSSLWFLAVLFETLILFEIFYLIKNKLKFNRLFNLSFIILMLIAIYFSNKYSGKLWFGITIVPNCLLWVYIGYIFRKVNLVTKIESFRNKNYTYFIVAILLALGYYLSIKNGRVNLSTNLFNNYLFYIIIAIINLIAILLVSVMIGKSSILKLYCDMSILLFCSQRLLFKLYYITQDKLNISFIHSSSLYINMLTVLATLFLYFVLYKMLKFFKNTLNKFAKNH